MGQVVQRQHPRFWLARGLEAPPADRLRALIGAGMMAWYQADAAQAMRWHEQALARAVGDREAEAFMLTNLAVEATELGDFDRAMASHEAG